MMRRINLVLMVAIMALATSSMVFAGLNQFSGRWKNVDSNTRGVTTLNIVVRGTSVTVQAWGKSHPQDTDWGKVKAFAYAPSVSSNLIDAANSISAVFRTNFGQRLMIIKLRGRDRIQAEVFTHFTDRSRRTDYSAVYNFARAVVPVKPVKEDCVSFNPDTATVVRREGRWKIVDGDHWLFDFGNKKDEAEQALKIIKHYRMNQSCFVGRPDPSFQYMLVSGRAPVGSFRGEDCVSFNPDTIEVKRIRRRWKIVDCDHWLFDFGNNESEAKQTLAIIKKYGFKYSCFVGRPDPSFKYLRK